MEFLNSLRIHGTPNLELKHKVCLLPVMLLRNITKVSGYALRIRFIEANIITGTHVGKKIYIPRIVMAPT